MSTPPTDVVVLANPVARSGAGMDAAATASERLRARGIRSTVVVGASARESIDLLRTALDRGADAVAVAGGDGTVNLALPLLAGTGIPLGILPIGTGNDFATALGLRGRRVDAAADVIANGTTRVIDLARITRSDGSTRLFGTVLASGFDSKVNVRANAMRWPRGRLRYDLAVLVEFALLRSISFRVTVEHSDGAIEAVDQRALLVAVGNGRSYGGGIPICPDADPADGLLEVTIVRPAGRARLLAVLARAYRGTHVAMREVSTLRVRRIGLDAPGLTAYADGEPVGSLPLDVEVVPGALTVFSP